MSDNKNTASNFHNNEATDNKLSQINIVDDSEKEIDLIDLAFALLDKLHNIVLFFLLGAVLLNAYSYFTMEPTYQSTSKLYIVSASSDSVVNLQDLNLGSSLTSDYEELILSYPVLDKVADKLGIEENSDYLASMISLSNPANTRILKITTTSTDPQFAKELANTVAEVAIDYLPSTMKTMQPTIAQEAKLALGRSGPSYTKYTVIGALLGAILYCAFVIATYMMDNTIHNSDDLEKYFGIVPLTSIPESEQFRQDDGEDDNHHKKGWFSRRLSK